MINFHKIKWFLCLALGVLIFTSLTIPVLAQNEFSSSYNITYNVDETGLTTVTEKITLKNLTDKYYASDFKLTISATDLRDVSMTDSQGPLDVQVNTQGTSTTISTQFDQQVAGKGKEYTFTLNFRSKDFAQNMGKVWQVTIPRISSPSNLEKFDLTLSVPNSFGDPTSIYPEPIRQSETVGKLNYFFSKDQLSKTGILASFGTEQLFNYNFGYQLKNDGLLPKYIQIPLPIDSANQKTLINSIEPKPENVVLDEDGNYLAIFNVRQRQNLKVNVSGFSKLARSEERKTLTEEEKKTYTESQRFWEKDSPQIKTKLNEILSGNPATVSEKARLINQFVASYLQYDSQRVANNDFTRLGALTALSNPSKALCTEYADLFVTLARSAGIPAREVIGYAYTTNTNIRPLSMQNNLLHAWAEYYDDEKGWVEVDPTWESTTGGVDYFSQFDLNHLAIAYMGESSEQPIGPSEILTTFAEEEVRPKPQMNLQIYIPNELFAGFPASATTKIENTGNIATTSARMTFTSQKLTVEGPTELQTPIIPPFGNLEYKYKLGTQSLSSEFTDNLELIFGNLKTNRVVQVKPLFYHQFFAASVFGVVIMIILLYAGTLAIHHKSPFHQAKKK